MYRVALKGRLGRSCGPCEPCGRRDHAQAKDLENHAAPHEPPETRAGRLVGARQCGGSPPIEQSFGARRILGIIPDKKRFDDDVGFDDGKNGAEEQQFLYRAVALDSAVDDPITNSVR